VSDATGPAAGGHPLSGVLDRLLARERGAVATPLQRTSRERPLAVAATEKRPSTEPAARRMLVVAGLGPDEGDETRRTLARWALGLGRRPAALDIGCAEPASSQPVESMGRPGGTGIPLLSLPCAPERLKDESPEVLACLLERLRRHESSADFLLVRVSPACHMSLMRAALLAGGLVVPVTNSYELLYQAFQLARQALESFLDLALWPHSPDPVPVARFQAMVREVLSEQIDPLPEDAEAAAGALGRLAAPPEAGFLPSLIDSDTPGPPAELLRAGSLSL
jgi:hypothetical protein